MDLKVTLAWTLIILSVLFFVGTFVVAFTNHTGGAFVFLGFFVGLSLFIMIGIVGNTYNKNFVSDGRFLVGIFIGSLVFFLSSLVIAPQSYNTFTVINDGKEISTNGKLSIKIPYTFKIDYLHEDFTLKTNTIESLDNDKGIEWDISLQLKLKAGQGKLATLLAKFGSVSNWREEIKNLLKTAVNQYISDNFKPDADLPAIFNVDPKDIISKLNDLGYDPTASIQVSNPRLVISAGG